MSGLGLTVAALVAVSSGAQEVAEPTDSCRISGVVLDPDGAPVADTGISLYWYTYDSDQPQRRRLAVGGGEMTTGPKGEFEFAEVVPGSVSLYATIPGMLRASAGPLRLQPGQAPEALTLRSPGYGGSIVGTVADENGVPVEGAVVNYGAYANEADVVVALANAEGGRSSTRTDADGWFAIDTIQPGKNSLSVYLWGYPRLHAPDIEIAERGEVSLELVLQRVLPDTWTLFGTVADENGAGLPGANVEVAFEEAASAGGTRQELRHLTTGDLGEFLAYDLPPGATVFVQVHHPEHGCGEAEASGEAGVYRELHVELERGAMLAGTISSPDGEPLPNMQFDIRLSRAKPQGQWSSLPESRVQTDGAGRYALAGVAPGEWTLRTSTTTWRAYESEPISVLPGTVEVVHDIRFPAGGTIAGNLTAAEDLSGSDARVYLYSDTPRHFVRVAQMRDGTSFAFTGIEPGEYSLTGTAMGFWPASLPVALAEGDDNTDLRIELGIGPMISGTVLDVGGGPVADTVLLVDMQGTEGVDRPEVGRALMYTQRQVARTGPGGRFTVRGVSAGAVALVALKQWWSRASAWEAIEAGGRSPVVPLRVRQRLKDGTFAEAGGVRVSMADGRDVTEADIHLAKWIPDEDLCTVQGQILDASQRLSGASPVQVALSDDALGPGRVIQEKRSLTATMDAAAADEGGRFRIANVAPGEYYLVAGAGTDFVHIAHVELARAQQLDLGELRIPVAGALEGQVADAAGSPIIEGWTVAARTSYDVRTMWRDADSPQIVRAPIAPDGSYRIDRLDPGFWFVMTAGDRLPGSEIRRVFINGATERLDFRHAYAGRIAGRVMDTAGKAVARASVRCEGERYSWTPNVRSDPEGRWEVAGLPKGAYTLRASRAGYLPATPASVELAGEGLTASAELVLEPGGIVKGTLVGPNGAPFAGGSREFVVELRQGARRASRVFLRDDGTFISQTVRPGTYTIQVSRRGQEQGGAVESDPVSVAAGETVGNVVVELPEAGR